MPKLPPLTSKRILQILHQEGFVIDHTTGSHYILYHSARKARVTVPFHRKALPKGTIHAIFKSAGLTAQDIKKYL
ncbi:MAG TPA: type II toxin-antitoxin system HicA family toxin [Candidatus Paceibacterota bacterium]